MLDCLRASSLDPFIQTSWDFIHSHVFEYYLNMVNVLCSISISYLSFSLYWIYPAANSAALGWLMIIIIEYSPNGLTFPTSQTAALTVFSVSVSASFSGQSANVIVDFYFLQHIQSNGQFCHLFCHLSANLRYILCTAKKEKKCHQIMMFSILMHLLVVEIKCEGCASFELVKHAALRI